VVVREERERAVEESLLFRRLGGVTTCDSSAISLGIKK